MTFSQVPSIFLYWQRPIVFAFLTVLFGPSLTVKGTIFHWTGAADRSDWTDSSNWSPEGGPPGTTDIASLGNAAPLGSAAYPVILDVSPSVGIRLDSLLMNAPFAELIAAGHTIEINNELIFNLGTISGVPVFVLDPGSGAGTLQLGGNHTGSAQFIVLGDVVYSGNLEGGRTINVIPNDGPTSVMATTGFENHGEIVLTKNGNDGYAAILSISGPGESLINEGLLKSTGMEGSSLNRLDLELRNLLEGDFVLQVATELGTSSAVHINYGSIRVEPNVEWFIEGVSFTNVRFADIQAAGVIDVTGLDDTTLTNEGLFIPGFDSPGIVTIRGDFLQSTGCLEIEVGGLVPGSMPYNHDQVLVTSDATIDGRLDLLLTNDFLPATLDEIDIITAANVAGQFASIRLPNAPSGLAARVLYDDSKHVKVRFLTPETRVYSSSSAGSTWATATWMYDGNPDSPPGSYHDVTINNTESIPREITVDMNAYANKIDLQGASQSMVLRIQSNLSSIHGTTVGINGIGILDGGTHFGEITILPGGIWTGEGNVVGNIENLGTIRPGTSPGLQRIEGNYEQTIDGVLEIEIGGTTPITEYDVLEVTGTVTLGGELIIEMIDLGGGCGSGIFSPMVGSEFAILIAASGLGGSKFDNVQLPVTNHGTLNVEYAIDRVIVRVDPFSADFDADGVVDGNDFLIWQKNFGIESGAESSDGDADGDGDVDSDDYSSWENQFGKGTDLSAFAVSEPQSAWLAVIFAITLAVVGMQRGMNRTKSPLKNSFQVGHIQSSRYFSDGSIANVP